MLIVKQILKQQLPGFVYQANRRSDPQLYAEVLVDNLPPAFYDKALELLNQATLLEQLVEMHPEVGKHREWFQQLQAELVASITERQTPPTDAPRPEPAKREP